MILSYLPDRDRLLPFSAAGSKFLARISKRFRALRNRWLYLISYQENKITCLGEPEVFQVEPTNHCNLKCPMCPHDLVTRKLCFMPIDNFRKIIDQVRLYFDRTRLHNKGESLIHKGIEKFVSCSRGLAIHTTQSTNASALTPASGKQILDAGLNSLLTSFDGASKGAYKYFCVGAKYENVLKKVKSFLRQRSLHPKQSTRDTMSLINIPMTQNEIDAFKHRWQNRVDDIRIKPQRNWNGSSERFNALVDLSDQRLITKPCYWLWTSLVVHWNGRVVPCCMDYDAKSVLGNIHEKPLSESFNNRPFRELNMRGEVHRSPLCRGCSAPSRVSGIGPAVLAYLGRLTQIGAQQANGRVERRHNLASAPVTSPQCFEVRPCPTNNFNNV